MSAACRSQLFKSDSKASNSPVIVQLLVPSGNYQHISQDMNTISVTDLSLNLSYRNMEAIDTSDRDGRDAEVSDNNRVNSISLTSCSDSSAKSNSTSIQSISPNSSHHHFGTTSMLPVHSDTQLQVILPISSQSEELHHSMPSTHSMTTRLKSGTIERKNYAALLATFPKLNSLQIIEDDPFIGVFIRL